MMEIRELNEEDIIASLDEFDTLHRKEQKRNRCFLVGFLIFIICVYLYLRLFNTGFYIHDDNYYGIQYSTAWIVTCPGDMPDLGGRKDYKIDFYKCPYIHVLNVEEGVTGIYSDDYDRRGLNCYSKLNTIKLPSTLKEIGAMMFINCIALEKVIWEENTDNTVIYVDAFSNTGIREINIPNGVTEICYRTFRGNDYLEKVTIPDSVKIVGEDAFSNCVNLEEVTWSASVTEMESGMFLGCTNLTTLKNIDSLDNIAYNALSGTPITAEQLLQKSVLEYGEEKQ